MYLDWTTQEKDIYAIDIETDSLSATVIYVMCWENIKTKETGVCIGREELLSFFEKTRGSLYVGHNILKFDAPTLNRLVGTSLITSQILDTLVLCTLYSPNIEGGHSLEEWGLRIGYPKGTFSDWSQLSNEMIEYCKQDVLVTAELFRKITKVLKKIGFSEKSCYIQHHITPIIDRQQKNGFCFNAEEAIHFYQMLRNREEELGDAIRGAFPADTRMVRDSRVYLKSGGHSKRYDLDLLAYRCELYNEGRSYRAYEEIPFNIGSPKQRVTRLLRLGWEPTEFTKTGLPKPTEESLIDFAEVTGMPEAALITKWMSVNGRANMVNNWLDYWNEETGCIHGKLFVADTLRFRHQAPNTANIPAVRLNKAGEVLRSEQGYYTYEARDLWCARKGRVLVGTDAAGLELRMLAHYLNRPTFTQQLLEGDPHQYNADLAGVSRPHAKTLLYAIQYGAQAAKVGKILGRTTKEGGEMRQLFLDRLGITGVMNEAISEQSNGRVSLVDGSRVVCPSPHSALNYKLQGGGARVMAQGAIFLERHIRRHGLDSLKVGDIHDEWQYDVAPSDAREHSRLSVQSIREAGEELNLNLPLDGTAKEGRTWAETH